MVNPRNEVHLLAKKLPAPAAILLSILQLILLLIPAVEIQAQSRTNESPANRAAVGATRDTRLQDGHLMRRIGFGPTAAEL